MCPIGFKNDLINGNKFLSWEYRMDKVKLYTFLRYIIVGVINTIVGLSTVLLLFNILKLNYLISISLGNLIGVIVSFFLNKSFTFNYTGSNKESLTKFVLVSLFSFIVAYSLGFYVEKYLEHYVSNLWLEKNLSIFISSGFYTILGFLVIKK